MNVRLIGNYLAKIACLGGASMLPALAIALARGETDAARAFLLTILIQAALGAALMFVPIREKRMYAREGLVIVALSWITISAFGAFPAFLSGAIPHYVDALFESVSGFTTTGATVLGAVEGLPYSILYWRSFSHWLGGMGVLVLVLALAPSGRGNGMPLHILRAESPGPVVGKLAPKLHLTARILYGIYIGLTVIQFVMLLAGGMPVFDALTNTFATAGTGGFSVRNDSIASYSPYCQAVISVFMLLFGVNFSVYFLILMGDVRSAFKNTELRVYLGVILASTVAIALSVRGAFSTFAASLHHSFFQVVSVITTTGFSTVDFNNWGEFPQTILLILMVIGACAGSTGGGIKVSRVIILFKRARTELRRLLYPRTVRVETMDGKPVGQETVGRCGTFLFLYAVILVLSTLVVSLDGMTLKTNLSAVLSCLNNIGPGLDAVGPLGNFGSYSVLSKCVLMLDMLLGRLELFPLLLLFLPSTWRHKGY